MTEEQLLTSPYAEQQRNTATYRHLLKVDIFLHGLMEIPQYADEAAALHAELHDVTYHFVTDGQLAENQLCQ